MKTKTGITRLIVLIILCGFICTACGSPHQPRTVPDTDPPTIIVKFSGDGFSEQYTIKDSVLTPHPTNPVATRPLAPGIVYRVSVIASDNIAVASLAVNLDKEFFEISNVDGSPGTLTTGATATHVYAKIELPFSPGTTGTVINFSFKAGNLPSEDITLGMFNVVAMDWGQVGSSNNISQASIALPYQPGLRPNPAI